jgi:DNA repair ATPase RecN
MENVQQLVIRAQCSDTPIHYCAQQRAMRGNDMSEQKKIFRYDVDQFKGLRTCDDGDYVRYDDYEKLEQRNAELVDALELSEAANTYKQELIDKLSNAESIADNRVIELTEQLSEANLRLSGKTNYCDGCEDLSKQLAESEHSLNKTQRELDQYKNMYDASERQLAASEGKLGDFEYDKF